MFLSLLLLATGGLTLLVAQQTEAVVRRFSKPAIQSASALRGAAPGQAVIISGRIDQQTPVSGGELAIYDRERWENTIRPVGKNRPNYGPPTWMRDGMHHRSPFTLVTDEHPVPITNGHYAIEQPAAVSELGRVRFVGFRPGDEILVVGTTAKGGVAPGKVFWGTPEAFRKTLEEQLALITAERVLGCLLMGLGVLLLARWVALRIGRRLRSHRVPWETGLGILFHPVCRRATPR